MLKLKILPRTPLISPRFCSRDLEIDLEKMDYWTHIEMMIMNVKATFVKTSSRTIEVTVNRKMYLNTPSFPTELNVVTVAAS